MSHGTVQLELRENVAIIVLNRPDRLNALTVAVAEDFIAAVNDAIEKGARAIVLTGAGRAFSAGGDLREMQEIATREGRVEAFFDEPLRLLNEVVLLIRSVSIPFIAAVNGIASGGGCNLALACDVVIAAKSAKFNQAFIKIGLSPDCGGTFFLPRLIGLRRAVELMLTGDLVDAERAQQMGMINSVVEDGELMKHALALAERLAAAPTAAIGQIKQLVDAGAGADLATQLDRERLAQIKMGQTKDFAEGVAAFLEKRRARFTGG
jgi:2-(1,2-epoxy-1,2-dihydrophenyl)acetyl-CoA isomerase